MDTMVNLTGRPLAILIVAALCTAPIAFASLALYRRTVIRLMSKRIGSIPANTEPLDQSEPPTMIPPAKPEFVSFEDVPSVKNTAFYKGLRFRRWQAGAVYALGGICFAVLMTISFFAASKIALSPVRFIVFTWVFLWPAVLVVNFVASPHWRTGLVVVLVYFLVGSILGPWGFETSGFTQIAFLWTIENLIPTILLLLFLNRRVRAVGLMVFVFMSFGVAGVVLALARVAPWINQAIQRGGLARMLIDPFLRLPVQVFPLLVISVGFLILGALGWLSLQFLKWLYLHNRLNEHSLVLDPIWLIFAFFNSVDLVFENPWWILSGLAAFLIYKIVTWTGFAWLNQLNRKQRGLKLLILRVFSLGARSERLYSATAKAWRYVGNIRFITGPDLVSATVEPHNFLDFLTGQLSDHFIDSKEALERHVIAASMFPAGDGRYQIHDFFCYDDTWQMVLSRLAKDSDVILMDLRKFSRINAGCIFEINELINHIPLNKVVFVIDNTTDEAFLRESVEEAWRQMNSESPNRLDSSTIRLFHYSGPKPGDYNRLMHALSVACMSSS